MNNSLPGKYSLLTVIVNRSKAQRVLNYAKVIGIKRYTSLMGHGTVPNAILKMLELGDINKEVLLFVISAAQEKEMLDAFNTKFSFEKRNTGIIFSVSLSSCLGITHKAPPHTDLPAENKSGIVGIFTVVDKGMGEEIIAISNEDACFGGTIMPAHGSADHSHKIFTLSVQAEKETVLMLVPAGKVASVRNKLMDNHNFKKANSGIFFTFDVNAFYGLAKNTSDGTEVKSEETGTQYDAIWAVVPSGKDVAVIESAEKGGSTGGTIFHARGSHVVEHGFFLSALEPEKELVMLIAKREDAEAISHSINEDLRLDDPGTGVLFVFPIGNPTGLFVK